jgi:hypothetical protein
MSSLLQKWRLNNMTVIESPNDKPRGQYKYVCIESLKDVPPLSERKGKFYLYRSHIVEALYAFFPVVEAS